MTNVCKTIFKISNLSLLFLLLLNTACTEKVKEKSTPEIKENEVNKQPLILYQNTTFPQIHTNLNGMVREFVRVIHQFIR